MPYDEVLATRIRQALRRRQDVTEKKQFGGIAFMINGNVACAVVERELLLRVGPEKYDATLRSPHARSFEKTGRPSKGWVLIKAGGLSSQADIRSWIRLGVQFASSLPPK